MTSKRAFTLLELLVAATITVGIATLLLAVAQTVLRTWHAANGRWSTLGAAGPALDQIERDLRSAVAFRSESTFFTATILLDSGNSGIWVNPGRFSKPTSEITLADAISDCRFGATSWLRFFIGSAGTSSDRSMVRAVSYQIVRRPLSGTTDENAYILFRGIVNEANTMAAGNDIVANGFQGMNATEGNAGNIRRPNANQVLADNVVDFGVRLYARTSDGLFPLFPASGGAWNSGPLSFELRGNSPRDTVPVLAEVMIRVLTDEGAQKLRMFEDPLHAAPLPVSWWSFVEEHSHVYVRRIWLTNYKP